MRGMVVKNAVFRNDCFKSIEYKFCHAKIYTSCVISPKKFTIFCCKYCKIYFSNGDIFFITSCW